MKRTEADGDSEGNCGRLTWSIWKGSTLKRRRKKLGVKSNSLMDCCVNLFWVGMLGGKGFIGEVLGAFICDMSFSRLAQKKFCEKGVAFSWNSKICCSWGVRSMTNSSQAWRNRGIFMSERPKFYLASPC